MMNRRLYFLLPDKHHALTVVDELVREGIDSERIHTLGSKHTRVDGLPASTLRQTNDAAGHLESLLWNANLISFALALVILVVLLLTTGWSLWLPAPAALMVTIFLGGVSRGTPAFGF